MIYFIEDVGSSPKAQNVALRDLPLRDVGQHFPFTSPYNVNTLLLQVKLTYQRMNEFFRFSLFLKKWLLVLGLTATL